MAKHINDGKGKVSKGLRTSCKGNIKRPAAIIVRAERVATAMREAFLNLKVESTTTKGANIVNDILTAAGRNAGNKPVGRGWTANLSPRTVRQLTEQGVFG